MVVHVLEERKAREAIAAGADGLAHLFAGDSAGSDFGHVAAGHHVFVIPTSIMLDGVCGQPQGGAIVADPHLAPFVPAKQLEASKNPSGAGPRLSFSGRPNVPPRDLVLVVLLSVGSKPGAVTRDAQSVSPTRVSAK